MPCSRRSKKGVFWGVPDFAQSTSTGQRPGAGKIRARLANLVVVDPVTTRGRNEALGKRLRSQPDANVG